MHHTFIMLAESMDKPHNERTLVQAPDEESVVGVLAHELGHWSLGHTFQMFIIQQVLLRVVSNV
jgi:hypothetical protein